MRNGIKKLMAIVLAGAMAASTCACTGTGNTSTAGSSPAPSADGSSAAESTAQSGQTGADVTMKITWWGGQSRHEYTQKLLDVYTQNNPNVKFEASPAGWDGYFDKLATQTASGSMPDIVQMDYLYISTYAKNNSVADLLPYMDNGTIDVTSVGENILNTGKIGGKMAGMVLATSILSVGYNPDVLKEAGVETPTGDWTWSDFITMNQTVKDKTGKMGASMGPVDDTNIFHYWVRQHGEKLFSDDYKSLGYQDDKLFADFLTMWKTMMDAGAAPNPDEWEQIQTLGQEAGPVVTGESAMTFDWNNYAARMASANSGLKLATPPKADSNHTNGLWMKPGMFFSVAETSKAKDEAAKFINWFVNSEEANDIIMAERGTPVSSKIRDYMVNSGKMTDQQKDMFQYVDDATALCGETPAPDPVGMSEVNKAFKDAAYSAFYGQATAEAAAAKFRQEANSILARNN